MELEGVHVSKTRVKKCRFLTSAGNVRSEAEARSFIAMVREDNATHNCWAYRIDKDIYRYSDDGEPSGTAGKSIYAAICSSRVEQVVVVVTRYFGAKLGAGGLIRAYNSAAARCLEQAAKRTIVRTVDLNVTVAWEEIGALQSVVESMDKLETFYFPTGCTIRVRVEEEQQKYVEQKIVDACAGAVEIARST